MLTFEQLEVLIPFLHLADEDQAIRFGLTLIYRRKELSLVLYRLCAMDWVFVSLQIHILEP